MCSSKLPKLTLSLWEQSLHNKAEIPTWQELHAFLTERHRTLEGSSQSLPKTSAPTAAPRRINSYETRVAPKPKGCDLCKKENHPVRTCARFLQMTVDERSAYIKRKQLCLNCFARGHQLRDCESFTCRGRHHTLLHRGNSSQSSQDPDQGQVHQLPPLPGPRTLQSKITSRRGIDPSCWAPP